MRNMELGSRAMQTWIFQANPDRFDIDQFLDEGPDETLWLAGRQGHQMEIGDQVFIWRSAGGNQGISGIIAECRMIEAPKVQQDILGKRIFWSDPTDATNKELRVRLRIVRVAHKKEVLQKKWLEDDPIARELTRVWGFPDYTTVWAEDVDEGSRLTIYGRLRFGNGDQGVNSRRIKTWMQALETLD